MKIITVVASIVLVQSLALAQGTGKDSGKPAQDTKGIFHRLEIMRRVLVRSLSETMESKAERKSSDDHSQKEVSQLLYNLARNQANNYDSRADYLPGYGAIFTLTMSLPLRPVTSPAKAGSPEKKESDGLWEKVEGEVSRGTSDYGWSSQLFSDGSQSERQRFEFDPAALDTLKRCLAGTLGRYAQRLNLGKQEWVGVSVRLLPSMNQTDGTNVGRLLADDYSTGFFDLGSAGSASSQRLVFQIPVQDLAKLGEGASDADLMQKAEIDVMVSEMTLQVAGRGQSSSAR